MTEMRERRRDGDRETETETETEGGILEGLPWGQTGRRSPLMGEAGFLGEVVVSTRTFLVT